MHVQSKNKCGHNDFLKVILSIECQEIKNKYFVTFHWPHSPNTWSRIISHIYIMWWRVRGLCINGICITYTQRTTIWNVNSPDLRIHFPKYCWHWGQLLWLFWSHVNRIRSHPGWLWRHVLWQHSTRYRRDRHWSRILDVEEIVL